MNYPSMTNLATRDKGIREWTFGQKRLKFNFFFKNDLITHYNHSGMVSNKQRHSQTKLIF